MIIVEHPSFLKDYYSTCLVFINYQLLTHSKKKKKKFDVAI